MHPTERFLSLIWPSVGNKCIVTIQNKIVRHYWYEPTQLHDAATKAVQLASQGIDVYYGLAGFTGIERKADQVGMLKCVWLDIDCGDGKEYPTRAAAGAGLADFVGATGLPTPLVIGSGGGLHVYWILDEDTSYEDWSLLATSLKQLCLSYGLQADSKCTADAARILRPIGTLNYKTAPPRPVRVLNRSPIEVHGSLVRSILLGAHTPLRSDEGLPFDWTAQPRTGPVPAERSNPFNIFDLPPAVAEGGRNDTLFKYGSSLRAKGYSAADVRRELHKANQTNCRPPLDTAEVDIIAASCSKFTQGLNQVVKANGVLSFHNPRVRVNGSGLEISMPEGRGQDTKWVWTKLADHGVRPVMEVRLPNPAGSLSHYVWMETYNDRNVPQKSFLVRSTGITNSATFATECGDNGFALDAEKAPGAYKAYHHIMREWVRKLQHDQGNAITFRTFGWVGPDKAVKDSFLLGSTIYRKDGPHAAPPVPNLFTYQEDMLPKGSLDEWTKAMDNYNLPGMEAYMFASWTAWAAPLMQFTSSQNIVFHLVGHTGVGKSSLQRSIVSTYGDFNSKNLVDMSESTFNSVGGMLGIFNALPYCKEEVTEAPPEQLATWALSMTQGREKGRMNQQLGVQTPRTWNTIAITSANTSLRDVIRNERMNNAAQLARVWEQDMTLPIDQMQAIRLFSPLRKNYGHAGPLYVNYLVQNYDDVKQQVIDTEEALFVALRAKGAERFNVSLLAAAFVGASIAINLGLIHHDFKRGRDYAIKQYNMLRAATKNTVQTEDQILANFIQETLPSILVVDYDLPTHAVSMFSADDNIIKDVPTGLPVIARFAKQEAKLYVTTHALRKWYADKKLNLTSDMIHLKTIGVLTDVNKRMTLTKGTRRDDKLQTRCYWFDLSKSTELIEAIGP